MSIGRLVVELTANTGSFETDVGRAARMLEKRAKEIDKQVAAVAKAAGLAAAAAAAALGYMVKSAIDAADKVNDLSKATGLSAETISGFGYAAKLSGSDVDSLATGLKKLSSAAYDAAKGAKAPTELFQTLGVRVRDTSGALRPAEELLLDVADAFAGLEDGVEKSALATDLFGRSGTALIPLLNEGRAGIKGMVDEGERFGVVISGKTAAAADEFNDSLTRLGALASGFANNLATELLPTLNHVATALTEGSGTAVSFGKAVSDVIVVGFKGLIDVGSRVTETFEDVGGALGALAAAAVQVAQGEFRQAWEIIKAAHEDGVTREAYYTEFRKKLWEEAGAAIVESAEKTAKSLEKINGGADLQYIETTARRLPELSRTLLEAADEGIGKGVMDTLAGVKEGIEAIGDRVPEIEDQMSEFGRTAASNIQSAFADFLFDPFDDGMRGMLKGFIDVLRRMVAEAAAAKILEAMFGKDEKSGSSGLGDFLGGLLGGLIGGGSSSNIEPYTITGAASQRMKSSSLSIPESASKALASSKVGGITIVQNVDNRGATSDFIAAFPEIMRRNNEALKADLLTGLRRGKYRV